MKKKILFLLLLICSYAQATYVHVPLAPQQFNDATWTVFDNSDPTKRLMFELSGLTTGETKIITWSDANGTPLYNIVEDTTPQLGGDLLGQSLYDINDVVDINISGTLTAPTLTDGTASLTAGQWTGILDLQSAQFTNPVGAGNELWEFYLGASTRTMQIFLNAARNDYLDISASTSNKCKIRAAGTDNDLVLEADDDIFIAPDDDLDMSGDAINMIASGLLYLEGGTGTTITDGTGVVNIDSHLLIETGKELRFGDVGDSNYIGFEAPALTADQIWVLPNADGSANTVWETDGSGNLTPTSGTTVEWDAAYTHISSDGTDHSYINQDLRTTADVGFTSVTVNQDDDTNGFEVYGFDDHSSAYLQFFVNATGSGVFNSVNQMLFSCTGTNKSIYFRPSGVGGLFLADVGAGATRIGGGGGNVRIINKLRAGSDAAPSEDIHATDTVRADTAFNLNGTDGISQTLTFGGGGSGDCNSITVSGGIITAYTTVP